MTTGTNKFHEAARDGYLDFLREATRKDCNAPDDSGMTPTLWAAYQGNVDALRLLVSRGGDPDKCDFQGHTAVHFAALQGHLNALMFLLSFGCNIWGLTNEYRTAKDLTAENGHKDCLTLLDEEAAKQSAKNRKQVQKLKEKSIKEADQRVRKYQRMQKEQEQRLLKEQKKQQKENEKQRKYIRKPSGNANPKRNSKYKGRDIAAENRAKRLASIGVAGGKTFDIEENSRIEHQHDLENFVDENFAGIENQEEDEDGLLDENGERDVREPGFWLHTERPIAKTMMALPTDVMTNTGEAVDDLLTDAVEIEHVTNVVKVKTTHLNGDFLDPAEEQVEDYEEEDEDLPWDDDELDLEDDTEETSPLELFLAINNLDEYLPLFSKEDVDLEALMLLTDEDLKNMKLPLGPRRKLAGAIKQRKDAVNLPGPMTPSEL